MTASARPQRPLRRQIQARVMAVVNVPMRVLLGLPFPTPLSGRLMLLSYRGRKTGKLYRQPVSYVRQDHVLLTPGGGNWKWNLQDGQPVRIRLRGREVLARPELIQDVDEIDRLFAVMAAANPRITAFVPIPTGPDGHLDRGRLEVSVRYGFRIVRWRLGEGAERGARQSSKRTARFPWVQPHFLATTQSPLEAFTADVPRHHTVELLPQQDGERKQNDESTD